MAKRLLILLLVAGLGVSHPAPSFTQSWTYELDAGIAHVRKGEYALGLVTLDGLVRRWPKEEPDPEALARAHLYLAVAYFGLGQERAAQAHVVDALKLDADVGYAADEFPPETARFLEQTRAEYEAEGEEMLTRRDEKTGGSKIPMVLLGAAALGGAVAAVAAAGEDAPPPPVNPTPPPQPQLSDLSASVSSPANGMNINCTESVPITVTLTNRAQGNTAVTGVRRNPTRVLEGGCSAPGEYTFNPQISFAGPGSSVVLERGNVYAGISTTGCCSPGSACDGRGFCVLEQTFTVVTSAGEVNAGGVGYGVIFAGCPECSSTATGLDGCRGPAIDP